MSDTQIKPLANPGPLGLVGFGLTTVLLSLINAHILPSGGEAVVIPLALAYGGLIQLIAGLLEFRTGNTFGMVAFLSYGAFWWWFAILLLFAGNGLLDLSKAGPTIGVALLLWGVFTFYMWIATFRLNRALWFVFLTLWITFALLGIGDAFGAGTIGALGGYVGILCGASAMYTSFAEVTNATFGRVVVPVGARD
ncbi:GPR1/FUN34/YaaH family transporter [Salinisphaera sp. LB1]|uniref:acetate uptake transporter n=1 Tax=Salinisphaera sp. LB1 TaxID=2183911 RepID=UPI000D705C71|nr:GPR1/FUN34/YaaH family transporter [Salinisphaera sp. LB1]AWN17340.1 Transcriptional regulator [Salinisphaera sp. LB1]